ncbi:hypothetical protein SDRG_15386 [Saprolegnia diclina VS20]|uniref:Uncharacterized protein n=1 Tax=Saprolegnia diclina (strain VS20) TaxID=1156394 RepID=T0RB66_SAPDV|nr:hypothetical protein SDRG_15386 [Saprolegnia diclina VS20]EQC26797.1 hypothetical protein SDRG_15386 [Saprolegnia diclina VS20]|eukprot:XP_008619779.1 hypothetical protein SDRG_15386 [Saprolegnia diclina VS20]
MGPSTHDIAAPMCHLYKPKFESNPVAKIGGIAVPSWPLPTETLTALSTTYAGRVPAKDVVFRGFHAIPRRAFMFESSILRQLDPEQDDDDEEFEFSMTLAHFANDLTGDASALKPIDRPPRHTCATAVYFFPSTCVGGHVTVAPITSGHRSFGVYHAAYILDDYDSDYSYGPKPKFAPPPLPSIQELQDAARGYDCSEDIAVTIPPIRAVVDRLPSVLWPKRNSLCRVRLASCVELAVEYLRSGAERASCYNGHVLHLAHLTAGTPAFATADADVQMQRRCLDFKGECAGLDKTTLTPLQALVWEE